MSRIVFRINIVWITTLSVFLRWLVSPNPVYGSVHDDELMVQMARSILDGNWIGDYSLKGHLIMSKPPGLAMFLAYSHFLPWAPTVTVHLVLLMGFLILIRELRAFGIPRTLVVVLYLLAAFFPAWFNEPMSRIYREGFLTALTSVVLGSSLWLARVLEEEFKGNQSFRKSFQRTAIPTLILGIATGMFVITKPSWHFILVLVLSAMAARLWCSWRKVTFRQVSKLMASSLAALLVLIALPTLYVSIQNAKKFDYFGVDNFSNGSYVRAMKLLYGIEDSENRPYIDITANMRNEAYKVSPTMRLLRPYLELPDGQGWRYQPCVTALKVCDESGAWFPWEFRDAVERAGLGESVTEFNRTFSLIAKEIEQGCKVGRIRCESSGLAPGLDSLDSLSPRVVLNSIGLGIQNLLEPSIGFHQRGEARELTKQTQQLWDSTINGLPPRTFPTGYQSGTFFVSDVRSFLGKIYGSWWVLLITVSLIGIVIGTGKQQRTNTTDALRIIGVGSVAAVFVTILQISMLEASSGFYMTVGGNLYLLPMFPIVIGIIGIGLTRLAHVLDGIMERRLQIE